MNRFSVIDKDDVPSKEVTELHLGEDFTDELKVHFSRKNGTLIISTDVIESSCTEYDSKKTSTTDYKHPTVNICNCYKLSINKPLLHLKMALFCYYGAGLFITPFLTVLYKQRGITLSALSTITTFSPILQVLGNTFSGIIADKLGRSKPVLVANILLVIATVMGIVLFPKINHLVCGQSEIRIFCHPDGFEKLVVEASCNHVEGAVKLRTCKILFQENVTEQGNAEYMGCKSLERNEEQLNLSLSRLDSRHLYLKHIGDKCLYNFSSKPYEEVDISWCHVTHHINCVLSCTVDSAAMCSEDNDSNKLVFAYAVLFILYLTVSSNCFRCFDFTVMCAVKEHGSDYGHERFFAMMGALVMSPIAGIIADATTPEGGERNYSAALYLFIGMNCLLLAIVYKIPLQIILPGKNMLKNIFKLLKNLDVVMFLLIVFILGISWNFTKYFTSWFLEELNAPSVLIGLVTSANALYGLPILLTSKWCLKKLGTHQVFVLALLGYVVGLTGYSFLQNPWFSLILESHGFLTYYLFWVAVIEHSHTLAPEGLASTVISTAGAIHFGIGRMPSGVIGKMVMSKFGARVAFRFNAVMCLSFVIIYTTYLCVRRRYRRAV